MIGSSQQVTTRLEGDLPLAEPETVVDLIPANATLLVSGFSSVGYPKRTPVALAKSDRDFSLTVVSGGSLGEEIDTTLAKAGAIDRRFHYQTQSVMRDSINEGTVEFHDRHVGMMADEIEFGRLADPDVAIIEAVAVGEDWLVPSMAVGQTMAYVRSADRLVVELNSAQPLELQSLHDIYALEAPPNRGAIPLTNANDRIGDPFIRFDPEKLTAVVRTDERDSGYSFREPSIVDRAIAENLAAFISGEVERTSVFDDRIHMQFGVGGLGNALMGMLDTIDIGDRNLLYFGEVIQDGLLDMLDDGSLSGASATALALSRDGQDKLFEDVTRYAEDIVLRPVDVSNNASLVNRLGVIAVNSALEVDIYGHANSSHVGGSHLMNGIGGSGDYVRNAFVSVLALPSKTGDDIPRVVPMVPHVDHTEHDIDVIITEQGFADLRGLSPRERATCVIEDCAHPTFRGALREYFDDARGRGGHIPHDLDEAFSWNRDGSYE